MTIKTINAVLLHTQDVPRLVSFYRDVVGIDMAENDHGGGLHAEAHVGGVHFAIFPGGPAPQAKGPITFAFHVDDVHGEYDRIRTLGVEFEMAPRKMSFGGILARFRDPDGNGIDLMKWQSEENAE
jgi:predicted enzyme related to lactoylglutathione lyase